MISFFFFYLNFFHFAYQPQFSLPPLSRWYFNQQKAKEKHQEGRWPWQMNLWSPPMRDLQCSSGKIKLFYFFAMARGCFSGASWAGEFSKLPPFCSYVGWDWPRSPLKADPRSQVAVMTLGCSPEQSSTPEQPPDTSTEHVTPLWLSHSAAK